MPIYIYAHNRSAYSEKLKIYWDALKTRVEEKTISDLMSLQYMPHITLSAGFDEKSVDMEALKADLAKVFNTHFSAPTKVWMHLSYNIHCLNFEWTRMSMAVNALKEKYPTIPWSLDGYHCTLAHGTDKKTMKVAASLIPPIDNDSAFYSLNSVNYDITMWRATDTPNSTSFSTKKTWEQLWTTSLAQL